MTTMIGTDPEVFVKNQHGMSSAIDILLGTKENPRPVPGGFVQEDNVLAEFNITPATTPEDFVKNIDGVFHSMTELLNQHGLHPVIQASHEFPMDQLKSWGFKAMDFGCNPELNAWTMEWCPKPKGAETPLRTAGGHIHVGYDNPTDIKNYQVVQLMDLVLGVPSIIIDEDNKRRELYGKAGSMRHKDYGVEYRVLSNFWLKTESLKKWVFNQSKWVVDNLHRVNEIIMEVTPQLIVQTINQSDKHTAQRLVNELSIIMP